MKKIHLTTLATLLIMPLTAQSGVIRDDYKKHFGATFGISYGTALVLDDLGYEGEDRFWRAAAAGVGVGLAKEIADSQEKGNHFDKKDLLFDVFGSLVGAASYEIYDDWQLSIHANSESVHANFSLEF